MGDLACTHLLLINAASISQHLQVLLPFGFIHLQKCLGKVVLRDFRFGGACAVVDDQLIQICLLQDVEEHFVLGVELLQRL